MTIIALISLVGSVLLGGALVALVQKSKNDQFIKLMLAFSGGFLLSIAFIHFIPELYEHSQLKIGIYILLGFLIQLVLEFFSGGIEHGHVHYHGAEKKIPYGILIALCIHSFIEGMPLGNQLGGGDLAISHHHDDDQSLLLGIIFHRIPVAIALMSLLVASKVSNGKAWMALFIFAITAPIGVLIGIYSPEWIAIDFNMVLGVVVGMFLHISTTIIFETSENHKFNFLKLLTIVSGCGLAFLIH